MSEELVLEREFAPPPDTRAWTRGQLLSLSRPHQIDRVDWDLVRFRFQSQDYHPARYFEVRLDHPLGFTRAASAAAFPDGGSLADALPLLGTVEVEPPVVASASASLVNSVPDPYE